eukprot:3163106-Pleurochrysis_carterae.AAC.5
MAPIIISIVFQPSRACQRGGAAAAAAAQPALCCTAVPCCCSFGVKPVRVSVIRQTQIGERLCLEYGGKKLVERSGVAFD